MTTTEIAIQLRWPWRHRPWRWIKVVNVTTGKTAYCCLPWRVDRALDKVTDEHN